MSDKPIVIPQAEHTISRKNISKHALKVLTQLKESGYDAYLVGGCVRDLLLERHPKDFDIATNAGPEEVKAIFRNCRLVGRRFRLAHVHFGREIIEVATFRALIAPADEAQVKSPSGIILRDNVYGDIEQDAWRRDFSINALYYNINDLSVVDYTGGLDDLHHKVLRIIGDPDLRYREDPVRMIRAIRFAAKLNFSIDQATAAPFSSCFELLLMVPPIRLYEEIIKCFLCGSAVKVLKLLRAYGFFQFLFPQIASQIEAEGFAQKLITKSLMNTDQRLKEAKSVNPAFIIAALLWLPMQSLAEKYQVGDASDFVAYHHSFGEVFKLQNEHVLIPRRITYMVRDIWVLQLRLGRRTPKRVARLLQHKRFRAAYDFLLLRVEAGEETVAELADWWTKVQTVNVQERNQMIAKVKRK